MARTLTTKIQKQIENRNIKTQFLLKIAGVDRTNYLISHSLSTNIEFGAAAATFILVNEDGIFNDGGAYEINVGDIVEFSEYYRGDTTEFKKFYGQVNQRSIEKTVGSKTITIQCLDYISLLQYLDIDLIVEGTKVEITNETLTPVYLPSPNEKLAQVFNFANTSIADNPPPIFMIRDKLHNTDDPQNDGYEISYQQGQMKLGSPINAYDNYDILARSYYIYTKGVYLEDVLEDIICQVDGYGKYLFGETSAQDVIDNHLTDTFLNIEGTSEDYMVPNYTNSTITIETTLTSAYDPNGSGALATTLYVTDTSGFPTSGEGEINGDIFTWTGKTATTLTGIPTSGTYALKAHAVGSYVKYEATYTPGQVWYMRYNNLVSDLECDDFTVAGDYQLNVEDDCIAHWKLNDNASSTTVLDSVGNNNGTATDNTDTLTTTGVVGNSLEFNGTNQRVNCGHISAFEAITGDFSMGCWVRRAAKDTTNADGIIGNWHWDSSLDNRRGCLFRWYINSDNAMVALEVTNGTNIQELQVNGAAAALDTWYFLLMTYTKSDRTLRFYINNTLVGSSVGNAGYDTPALTSSSVFWIGYSEVNSSWLNGAVDNVMLFDRVLTSTERTLLYNSGSGTETLVDPTIQYVDKRFGRIILNSAISVSSIVKSISDYSFKTLQATGIELNYISFKPRELENRFEAVKKLKEYAPPNWIIRTRGDNKIWASLLYQRTTADYTLDLIQDLNYMEDEDLYTRVIFYAKNKNPSNIMFKDGVDFVSTGETYKSLASNSSLTYLYEEGNSYVFGSIISNAGYIDLEQIVPIVYINGWPIDNKLHQMISLPVVIETTTRTETKSGCHGISKEGYTKIHTYYYYNINLAHTSIEPSQPIYFYDATGLQVLAVSAYDLHMDYARGIYHAPGESQNSVLENIASASYTVMYSTNNLIIDYDNVLFKINKSLIPDINKAQIKATYEYWSVMTPIRDVASIIDGRWDTQVQTEFFATVPSGYNYAIVDLGSTYNVQAVDLVAGFYKPDEIRKFDIDMKLTLQYSTDNINYYEISDKTNNFQLSGGQSISFEETELGTSLSARYLKIVLENVEEIDYGNGVFVVAFSELAAYDDIVLRSNATLIPTTYLTADIDLDGLTSGEYPATINVESTEGFDEPESAEILTAYIANSDGTFDTFNYTGLTTTTFTGVTGLSSNHLIDAMVVKEEESDTTVYDYSGLLPKLGDRIYKQNKVNDELLFEQSDLDYLAKRYLLEYIKDHTKVSARVIYQPFLEVGQTVSLTDSYGNVSHNYFIESINEQASNLDLVLAYYPS